MQSTLYSTYCSISVSEVEEDERLVEVVRFPNPLDIFKSGVDPV